MSPIPEYTSQVVQRSIGAYCSEYLEFAKAFSTHDDDKLQETLVKHQSVFQQDHNLGLAKQCLPALRKRVIQRLTQTYLTLSLEDLALKGKVKDAEEVLLGMIENKEIVAKMDQKARVAIFEEGDHLVDQGSLQASIDQAINLGEDAIALDESLMTNRAFLQNQVTS